MRRAWLWRRLSLWRLRRGPWSCPAISARHDLRWLLLLGGVPLGLVILRPVLALVRVLRLPLGRFGAPPLGLRPGSGRDCTRGRKAFTRGTQPWRRLLGSWLGHGRAHEATRVRVRRSRRRGLSC